MKFVKVNVKRTQSSVLYFEVPDNFDYKSVYQWRRDKLEDLIDEQLHEDFDWSSNYDYEVECAAEIAEEEATEYRYNTIDNSGKLEELDADEDLDVFTGFDD